MARQAAVRVEEWRPRPKLPQRRVILGTFGVSLLCVGMALAFWLPSHSLVHDLRSRGITAAATVSGVDSKPKYVKVRLVSSSRAGTEVRLSDYAGMYPDTRTGTSMLVTYDPKDPSRILARSWVEDPPANLPAYGTSALGVVCLCLTAAVTLRRRWILRSFGREVLPTSTDQAKGSTSGPVRLSKP
ncbi:DUF3592 domain-containing protein [Streptomyces sp. NPDC028635]|uniref:DUF3592 domain-containing protein n=1 Tax=Streptomyces sp. NPDC028635 TaxID=3154800 RepID=UPI0033EA3F5D